MIVTPLLFFRFSASLLVRGQGDAESLIAITAYSYSPFLIAAGLSIFPLAACDSAALALPIVAAVVGGTVAWPTLQSIKYKFYLLFYITRLNKNIYAKLLKFMLLKSGKIAFILYLIFRC